MLKKEKQKKVKYIYCCAINTIDSWKLGTPAGAFLSNSNEMTELLEMQYEEIFRYHKELFLWVICVSCHAENGHRSRNT